MLNWTRRWHRGASAVLLIGAGAQLSLHWQAYVAVDTVDAARIKVMQTMQGQVLYEPWGTTLWTALGFFSLAYAALLILFGTSQWILARECDPRTLRRHALRNSLLCLGASAAIAWLHPMPHGLLIFGAASVLFGLAAWPRPHDH
jgi:hypothetical protein